MQVSFMPCVSLNASRFEPQSTHLFLSTQKYFLCNVILGVRAKELISKARRDVAYAINAKPSDIVFTSGGTESNNWVIHTAITDYNLRRKERSDSIHNARPHIVSSTVEHDSISLPLNHLADNKEIGKFLGARLVRGSLRKLSYFKVVSELRLG